MRPEQIEKMVSAVPCFAAVPSKEWQQAGISTITLPARPVIEEGHIFQHASFVLSRFIYRQFIRRMVSVTGLVEEMSFYPMAHRVADLLLRKTNAQTDAPLYATHQSLSIELGTAREVVSRILKDFERRGSIRLGRGKIYLVQRSDLERLVQV
ncbi:helix-turn-helix domain-containing protein [Brevibacillus humidisoli]|uniref:Crp/Fnr family transcriptional regulator n=1 Tax=Brevibacillus humidisoli TaxID=2895522 RepID=UPI001E4ACF48|nr:helix-turn-helix domain-containing protein [Brevibacillus humidisoli]UFJ41117.1 helix-turn-helix domain-containing protein [Brevibacillus humidisoli]